MRAVHRRCSARPALCGSVIMLVAVGLGGCSADVTRFADNPFANPISARGASLETTGSINATPPVPVARVERESLQSAPLPAPQPAMLASYPVPRAAELSPPTARVDGTVGAANWAARDGTPITVAPGETVESLARRYGVPSTAIMRVNNLSNPSLIRPGQRLIIPRFHDDGFAAAHTGSALNPQRRAAETAKPKFAADAAGQTHVVAAGESLNGIARKYHKSRLAIAKANNLAADGKLRIGQKLVIPGSKHEPLRAAATASEAQGLPPTPAVATTAPASAPSAANHPRGDPAPAKNSASEAEGEPQSPGATAAAGSATPNFRWPVHGKIISGFGSKAGGQQNDGINLAVPEGTPIKAAEDGVVAYAGSELKGYGNLVLVRHANGFVTAYANANDLMVKRGDQVKRGQVIAHSGQTGSVTAPQLHFEIRKGATPVDPTQYLSGT